LFVEDPLAAAVVILCVGAIRSNGRWSGGRGQLPLSSVWARSGGSEDSPASPPAWEEVGTTGGASRPSLPAGSVHHPANRRTRRLERAPQQGASVKKIFALFFLISWALQPVGWLSAAPEKKKPHEMPEHPTRLIAKVAPGAHGPSVARALGRSGMKIKKNIPLVPGLPVLASDPAPGPAVKGGRGQRRSSARGRGLASPAHGLQISRLGRFGQPQRRH